MEVGEKKDLKKLLDDIKQGVRSEYKLLSDYGPVWARNHRAVSKAIALYDQGPERPYTRQQRPLNAIWFGDAGTGKTYQAEELCISGNHRMFKVPMNQLKKGWYDGYNREEIILFDDFRGSTMTPNEFLNLLDGIPRLNVKGAFATNKATLLLFTSPDHPINWWPKWYAKTENNWAQVKRRLDKVIHCISQDQREETRLDEANLYKNQVETIRITADNEHE